MNQCGDKNLSVLAVYYSGLTKLRNFFLTRGGAPLVRFVTYHDIPAENAGNFAATLRHLQRTANVVSIDDYFLGRLSEERTNVVITFDDGYRSWRTIAVPVLRQLRLPATFFISSGLLEASKSDQVRCADACTPVEAACERLSEQDVREMANYGFTIGGHTVSHVNLGAITDPAVLAREITDDRQALESITGKEIRYFAYPCGVFRNVHHDLVPLLKQAGYRGAVTVVPGLNPVSANPYLLNRELTGVPMPLPVFAARVDGAYDVVNYLRRRLRSVFSR